MLTCAVHPQALQHCTLEQVLLMLSCMLIFCRCPLQAERGYRQGLLMYPRSPALLRSYAQFMQDIKLNPHASMRYYVEADKLEALQTEV